MKKIKRQEFLMKCKKLGINTGVGIIIVLFLFVIKYNSSPHSLLIADGVTIAGVLLLTMSFLRKMFRSGCFEWVMYLGYINLFLLRKEQNNKFIDFYDYKSTINYKKTELWTQSLAGIFFLLLGAIFTLLRC